MLRNLALNENAETMSFINQAVLPTESLVVTTGDVERVAEAIRRLEIRGAPAIGVSAAMAVAVGLRNAGLSDTGALQRKNEQLCDYLASTRPTAVNLFWALNKMRKFGAELSRRDVPAQTYLQEMEAEARRIGSADVAANKTMAKYAASLIRDGERIITICNDGALCSVEYGTAGGAFVTAAKEEGKRIHVYTCETRPLFQGARLTAWELQQEGIPYTVLTDSMAAYAFANEKISMVMLGADRITCNGDTANKIGTYMLAILANYYHVPFYVVAPGSTLDLAMGTGGEITIEQRDADEVCVINGKRIAPEGAPVLNPAFDVTPGTLVSGIITERGIFKPPFTYESLVHAIS